MKAYFLFLFIVSAYSLFSQCQPQEFKRIFEEANAYKKSGNFIDAKNNFEASKTYACSQSNIKSADDAIDSLFVLIEQLRIKADIEKNRADSTAIASQRQALRAYANDLAYKSQIALRDGDRTTAFRLAEFAHRYVDDDNLQVTCALCDALYYNDNPPTPPLDYEHVRRT